MQVVFLSIYLSIYLIIYFFLSFCFSSKNVSGTIAVCPGAGDRNPGGQRQAAGGLRRRQGHGDYQPGARGGKGLDGAAGTRGQPQEQADGHRGPLQVGQRDRMQIDGCRVSTITYYSPTDRLVEFEFEKIAVF